MSNKLNMRSTRKTRKLIQAIDRLTEQLKPNGLYGSGLIFLVSRLNKDNNGNIKF